MAAAIIDLDLDLARAQRKARQSRPLQGKLLRSVQLDPRTRAVMARAVADGFAEGRTTQDIMAIIRRDAVRQAAKAAL